VFLWVNYFFNDILQQTCIGLSLLKTLQNKITIPQPFQSSIRSIQTLLSKPINPVVPIPHSTDPCLKRTFSGQAHVGFQLFNGAEQLWSGSSSLQRVTHKRAGVLGSPVQNQTQSIIENDPVQKCTLESKYC